jgi:hypothetical protein
MRVRADWLSYGLFALSVIACASDKNEKPQDDSMSNAKDEGGKGSAGKSSSSDEAGKTSTSTGGKGGSPAKTTPNGSKNDEDAGPGAGGSGGTKASQGAAGSGGSPGNTGTTKPSEDGDQLALCSMAQGDCNKGLACHAPANALSPGRGFCSKICENDMDCSGVAPSSAKYTCATGAGTKTCELVCSGADDKSCPSGLSCVQTAAAVSGNNGNGGRNNGRGPGAGTGGTGGAGGSNAGTPAQFRCRIPFDTSPTWGACGDGSHVCAKEQTCSSSGFGRAGHCEQSCEMDADCKDKPSSGSITPSCATITPARGMTAAVKRCVLDCSMAKDGCPTGGMCVDGPRTGMGMNAKPEYQRCQL